MSVEQGGSIHSQTNEAAETAKVAGVAESAEADGAVVLQEVVRMTGLSSDYLDEAISGLLGRPDSSVNDLSLEELRHLLLQCLESMNEQIGSEPPEPKIN